MQYKWTVLTVTTVGVLMSGIDSRIIVIGIPEVAAALGAGAEQAIWFTQAYVFGSTVALLFIGRVSDMMGRVKIYAVGFLIFTAGSFLTSISPSPDYVIIFRILQGLGSAALFANSAAIITDATPSDELGLFLGINQVAFRVGAMAGLTLSGLILLFLDWRVLFYINVPIGIFGTLWARRRLKELSKPEKGVPMDWTGFFTFTAAIVLLLLALTYAAYGTFPLDELAVLLAGAAAFFALFILRERRTPYPLLNLGLLRIREFTGGVTAQMLNSLSWGAVILLLSLYLQLVKGMSPFAAGIAIIPFDVAFLAVGPLSGRLSDRYGHMPFTTTGLAIISGSLLLFSTTTVSTPYLVLAAYLVVFGVGLGVFSSPNMSSVMGSVPPSERGVASGVRATFFNVGYVLSFNVALLVMTAVLPYSTITAVISSGNPAAIAGLDKTLFARGIDYAFEVSAVINAVAILPSVLRGKRSAALPEGRPGPLGGFEPE
ncbi:MAG: MFS transporter [Nitrososphaerota archaeon]|nr:MFS transporter [Nitrososphaerota archaeon]MDG6937302.1 MFS transporter [Nitrososphaerota archaeon]MDG6961338.1 MFS transporter [Nitrososphaerota archaeon]MDG6962844.1 MFS transporter [Nitrososphaerota archaeon]MDG6971173.1 MFS transporter [Nitrososphaerota archaeon]